MTLEPGFSTTEMDRIFSAATRVELFCRFEAALAQAQAEEGVITQDAAAAISAACIVPVPHPETILAQGWDVGTPVQVLLDHLRRSLPDEHAPHLHLGATTQDVVDTAAMLQSVAALEVLDRSLRSASESLATLADSHRRTPSVARTLLQEAVATTHGARFARWLVATNEARWEIRRVRGRLPVQLGGPVGDAVSFGRSWPGIVERLAEALGLAVPEAPWHTDRRPVEQAASVAGRVASVASKIASDVALLAAAGEIRVRGGVSSSMPHKRNSIDAVRAEAAAEVCRAAVAGVVGAPAHMLERAMGTWHAEWALLPLAFTAAGAAGEAIDRCLASLEVDEATEEGEEAAELVDRALEAKRRLEE